MSASSHDLSRIRALLTQAGHDLGLTIKDSSADSIAEIIAGTMGGNARFFHNADHILQVAKNGDAVSALAAIFHDLVYLQIDGGIGPEVRAYLDPFVEGQSRKGRLRKTLPGGLAPWVCSLFGVAPGTELSSIRGLNEFLSTLVAARLLENIVPPAIAAQVFCCIELTIPFRKPDAQGKTPAMLLCDRLMLLDAKEKIGLGDIQCRNAVRRAVRLANQDVGSFGASKGADFLAHTWELVPETNPLLRAPGAFTVAAYSDALQQMEKFFSNLSFEEVFQDFDGEPEPSQLDRLRTNAKRNIEEGRCYFRLKLIALSLIEAMGGGLGKDESLPVLLGEISNLAGATAAPKVVPKADSNHGSQPSKIFNDVLELLENPPQAEAGPTLKSSPMTAFLAVELGFAPMLDLWESSIAFLKDPTKRSDLLKRVPEPFQKKVLGVMKAAIKKT